MLEAFFANIPLQIIATGALVGIAASVLGSFLVLRGNSMLTDAISHSIVFGIVVVWLITGQQSGPVQIAGAALAGILTVWLTELLAGTGRVKQDAAIGLVFPVLFSLGVLLINIYARDVHIDQHTVLLGEIGFVWLNTVNIGGYPVPEALLSLSVMTVINGLFVSLFFKELKLATFDRALARALGFAPGVLFYLLLGLTSATAVTAFDAVGAVMFVAFAIVPPGTARLLTDNLPLMIVIGCLVAIIASAIGYWLAVLLNVNIGAMMASTAGIMLLLAFLFAPGSGFVWRMAKRTGLKHS